MPSCTDTSGPQSVLVPKRCHHSGGLIAGLRLVKWIRSFDVSASLAVPNRKYRGLASGRTTSTGSWVSVNPVTWAGLGYAMTGDETTPSQAPAPTAMAHARWPHLTR